MKKQQGAPYLLSAIIVATVCLRAPITAVGPLIGSIRASVPLPSSILGLLTTIPLVMFALVSPFVSRINTRMGTGRTMLYSLLVMAAGLLMRSYAGGWGMFLGTVLLGFGVSFGNVLIPGVIKAEFPLRIGMVTSAFTIAMSSFAALSSAISYPLSCAPGLDWRHSLAVWLIPVLAAALLWFFIRKERYSGQEPLVEDAPRPSVYRSPIAWWLTVLMGAQALMFYLFSAWLPSILQSRGISPEHAGYITFAYQLMTMPSSFLIPALAMRRPDQKGVTAILALVYAVSVTVFTFARSTVLTTVSVMVCGFSTGACFSLCMLLIGLRTATAKRAVQLSGMVQSLGYGIAAVGPTFAGFLFDQTGSWTTPLLSTLSLTVLIFLAGRKAGENRLV